MAGKYFEITAEGQNTKLKPTVCTAVFATSMEEMLKMSLHTGGENPELKI